MAVTFYSNTILQQQPDVDASQWWLGLMGFLKPLNQYDRL